MTYKAAIPLASGIARTFGNATIRVLPGAEPWVPDAAWLTRVSHVVPQGCVVTFERRQERKYPYRAVADRDLTIRIFVDETETPESVKWLMLHELFHARVSATPEVARALRSEPRPPGYPLDDDAHEALLEEQLANEYADMLAPAFNTRPGLNRRWWRARTHAVAGAPTSNYGLVLPSASSAQDLVDGKAGSLSRVLSHMIGRAALVGTGIYLAGGGKNTVRYALAGSAAIEAFVLTYALYDKHKRAAG
jgi:hypothetical protein